MNLAHNIVANYASHIYVTLIGIVTVPLYITYMGAEAYGLVGYFAMLQAWFNILDMGITPTMVRETARFHGGATDAFGYREFVRALEGLFLFVALMGGGALFTTAGYIAHDWLQRTDLLAESVETALQIMAVIVALRWMCGLYRGVISGSEHLVWLGGFNAFIATIRFVGVFVVLIFIGVTPAIFFSYQLGVALLEFSGLLFYATRLMPPIPKDKRLSWSWKPIKPVFRFSLTIAFTSSVWVLVKQTDQLILSKLLPLTEYGTFTLATLVASGITLMAAPVSSAIIPRMTHLEATGDGAGFIRVYRQSTQWISIIAGAASITVAFCAEPLLWAWTGNRVLAHHAAPILILYAIGNGVVAVSAFPYYLQYAKGDLRLDFIANLVYLLFLIPAMIWAANQYGAMGTGYVWMGLSLFSFIAWPPFVYRKFIPEIILKWYGVDILIIVLTAAMVGYCLSYFLPNSDSRVWQMGIVIGFGLIVMLSGAMASTFVRTRWREMWSV